MGDKQKRNSVFILQIAQQVENLCPDDDVQGSNGFIAND